MSEIARQDPDGQLSLGIPGQPDKGEMVTYAWSRRPLTLDEEAEVDRLAHTETYEQARQIVAGRDYIGPHVKLGEETPAAGAPARRPKEALEEIEAAIDREDGFGFNMYSIRHRHGG